MAPPSALAIASGAVMRLSREEASYHTELAAQEAKAKALEDQIKSGGDTDDANAEFMLRQQRLAIEQTKAVFEPLRRQVAEARARLEEQMEASEGGANVSVADVEQARAVLAQTKSP